GGGAARERVPGRGRGPRASGARTHQREGESQSEATKSHVHLDQSDEIGKRGYTPVRGNGGRTLVAAASVQALVSGDREELDEVARQGDVVEQLGRLVELALRVIRVADGLLDLRELFVAHLRDEIARDGRPLGELGAVVHPLPDLRARDLSGRRVLHEVVDRRRSRATQP